jgi:hypothetical protein
VALHNKKAISMYGYPNKDPIKILLKVGGHRAFVECRLYAARLIIVSNLYGRVA